MSIIATKWAFSLRIDNILDKLVLVFLASHNFGKDECFFKASTIAHAVGVTIASARDSLRRLVKEGFIGKEARFNFNGSQLSNRYFLNIPIDFINKEMGYLEKKPPNKGDEVKSGGVIGAPIGDLSAKPLPYIMKNNNYEYNRNDKKEYTNTAMFGNVEKQSTSYNFPIENKEEASIKGLEQLKIARQILEQSKKKRENGTKNERKSKTDSASLARTMPNPWSKINQYWKQVTPNGSMYQLSPSS